jgi:hypothetical protein
MSGQRSQRLRPVQDRFVRAGDVLTALLSRLSRECAVGLRLRLHALHSTFNQQSSYEPGGSHDNKSERYPRISHGSPLSILGAGSRSFAVFASTMHLCKH